jgi:hypothetical protein
MTDGFKMCSLEVGSVVFDIRGVLNNMNLVYFSKNDKAIQ